MTNPHRSAASAGRLPSIRRALLLLGIACTAPTIFVAAGAAYEDFLLRKERVYEAALASARSLAGELERELRGVETGLRILATEDELQRGALPAFHRRLGDALRLQNVDGYMLLDPQGVPLADSGMPNPGRRSAAPCPTRRWPRWDAAATSSWPACSAPPCIMSRCWPSAYP